MRPGNPAGETTGTAGDRKAPPHKRLSVSPPSPESMIRGPLPWRINGPPVKVPAPGQAAGKATQVTVAGHLASPDGKHRNVQGQSLPYLLPARSNPNPAPANGMPRAN